MSDETRGSREMEKWLKDNGMVDDDGRARPLGSEKEHRERQKRRQKLEEQYVPSGSTMLDTRSAGEWIEYIRSPKNPEKLFGDFWHEGEVAILFGDTGKGKSLLAVQIADQIARSADTLVRTGRGSRGRTASVDFVCGKDSVDSPFRTTTKPQKVLYFDFELNQSQFAARYSAPGKTKRSKPVHYNFPKNLIRSEIGDFSYSVPKAYEKDINGFLLHSVTSTIEDLQAKVIIIDNITWLNSSTSNTNTALKLMKNLKHLSRVENLSILVLAHTPKRHFGRPLTVNDLQGSKMLANFADNIFALGQSIHGPDIRYLKHIKARSTQMTHDASNIILCQIQKMKDSNFFSSPPVRTESDSDRPPNSPPYQGGVDAASADGVVLSSIPHSAIRTPQPALFLGLKHIGQGIEREHLIRHYDNSNADRLQMITQAKALQAAGQSQRQIATTLGLSPTTINRYLTDS